MVAHNASGYYNHLILPKIVQKIKECDFIYFFC